MTIADTTRIKISKKYQIINPRPAFVLSGILTFISNSFCVSKIVSKLQYWTIFHKWKVEVITKNEEKSKLPDEKWEIMTLWEE